MEWIQPIYISKDDPREYFSIKMNDPLFGGSDGDGLNLPEYAQRTKKFLNKESLFFNLKGGFRDFYYNVGWAFPRVFEKYFLCIAR